MTRYKTHSRTLQAPSVLSVFSTLNWSGKEIILTVSENKSSSMNKLHFKSALQHGPFTPSTKIVGIRDTRAETHSPDLIFPMTLVYSSYIAFLLLNRSIWRRLVVQTSNQNLLVNCPVHLTQPKYIPLHSGHQAKVFFWCFLWLTSTPCGRELLGDIGVSAVHQNLPKTFCRQGPN